MATTPPRLGTGVDFSNVRRQNLYATPRRSESRISYSHDRKQSATQFHTPSSASSVSFGFSRSGGGDGGGAAPQVQIGNSSRKRSRGSYYGHGSSFGGNASKIPSSATTTTSFSTATPRMHSRLGHPKPESRHSISQSPWTLSSQRKEPAENDDRIRERGYATPGTVSPPPLANSTYYLANGFDTPTAVQANAYEQEAAFSPSADSRFRRLADEGVGRHAFAYTAGLEGPGAEFAGPLGVKQGNGRSSAHSSTLETPQAQYRVNTSFGQGDATGDASPSWAVGKTILGAAAGVAGLVFHFCTAGAFRGFHAGGGQAWDRNGARMDEKASKLSKQQQSNQSCAPEAQWHDSDFAQDEVLSPSPRRAAKKMKSSYEDDGGMQSSWIMVDGQEDNSRASSPTPKSIASPAGLRQRARPGAHKRRFTGSVSMPVYALDNSRPASSAALRSPRVSNADNDLGGGSRPGSAARRSRGAAAEAVVSPLGKEGEKLVRMQRRRERAEDKELANMNRRLEEMIRQGKEALGTKYEVEELEDEMTMW